MYANAHIDPKTTQPFLVEDFMPGGNREARLQIAQLASVEVAMANAALMQMKPGETVDGIPDWAKGPYRGGA